MKVIPLSEAKANLSRYSRLCKSEPVIVTVNGVPAFELVPIAEDYDLINQLIAHDPDFRVLLRRRLHDRRIPASRAARAI